MSSPPRPSIASRLPHALPMWSLQLPALALVLLVALQGLGSQAWWAVLLAAAGLIAAVLSAVHHAEVVAHRVGEPFGTLVLALAVTVIEVALIVSLMLAGGASASALARDTVFAAVMIVCNGVVGLCLLVGGIRHGVLAFRVEGTSPSLAVLAALCTLTLVLPVFTTSTPGPTFSGPQLAFAGVVSLALYGVFVFVQTVRHRDYFLPADAQDLADASAHAEPPSAAVAWVALSLLMVCLVGVVGLAKTLAPSLEAGVSALGAPQSLVGVLVALLVLLPETWAAVRAAAHNRLQTSLNLAIGSALASIGLTIPAVAVLSLFYPHPLVLGLDASAIVMLVLTFMVGTLTLGRGRATVLQGAVHLVLFAVFLFLAVFP
ncbi:calcium:proton antiporter [Sphaerotilus mobilis]|nr:ionic transporter y4hA [Sphaerotilus mobilis]